LTTGELPDQELVADIIASKSRACHQKPRPKCKDYADGARGENHSSDRHSAAGKKVSKVRWGEMRATAGDASG